MMRGPMRLVRRRDALPLTHAELFLQYYQPLLRLARRLAGPAAEDLLHDGYVQFVLTAPDISSIERLDGYLAGLLRNLHLSRQRRHHRQPQQSLALVDFDSAELALSAAGPHQLIVREALARTADYICRRRTSSRAASVLALRFFIGFYPSEIAMILRSPRQAVYDSLRQARGEAREHLVAASAPTPDLRPVLPTPSDHGDAWALLETMRAALLAVSQPPCPTPAEIAGWYATDRSGSLSTPALAHLVGCRECLDAVAAHLGLEDTTTRGCEDTGNEPPPDQPSPTGGGHRSTADRDGTHPTPRRRGPAGALRRARDVFEHRPRQLFVNVNGLSLGGVAVDAAESDARWTVRLDEATGFVEVTSEQSLVLAHLTVKPLPQGEAVQQLRVGLSDSRVLTLTFDATVDPAVVTVHYDDPLARVAVSSASPGRPTAAATTTPVERSTGNGRRWAWAAAATILLVAGLQVTSRRAGAPAEAGDAAAIIARAESAVAADGLTAGQARHRRFRFELKTASGPMRYRIEQWEVGESPARATRVFDTRGALMAGEWVDGHGHRQVRMGEVPDDSWLTGLSPQTFRRYMAGAVCTTHPAGARVNVACVVSTGARLLDLVVPDLLAQDSRPVVRRAELVLAARTWRAERLTLFMAPGQPVAEVMIEEEHRAVVGREEVPASALEPDPPGGSVAAPTRPAAPLATLNRSLEVRLAAVLARLPASASVQVRRRVSGGLTVVGHVDTDADRRALTTSIAALGEPRWFTIDVRTLADVKAGSGTSAAGGPAVRSEAHAFPDGPAPFEQYLALHASQVIDPAEVTQRVAGQTLGPARQLLRHARALDAALEQFPPAGVDTLDASGRQAWRALMGGHAEAVAHALATLDDAFAPYLPPGDASEAATVDVPVDGIQAQAHDLLHDATIIADGVGIAMTASDPGDRGGVSTDLRHHIQQALRLAERVRTGLTLIP